MWFEVVSVKVAVYGGDTSCANEPSLSPSNRRFLQHPQAGNHERCNLCTTAFFEGQVAVMDPSESWTVSWFDV